MNADLSAAVLAGGLSSRFGSDKAWAEWGGRSFIETLLAVFEGRVRETLIAAKATWPFCGLLSERVRALDDPYPETHALGGLTGVLSAVRTPYVFVCACDMPLLSPRVLEGLWALKGDYQAVVPVWDGTRQPLCALYRRDAAPAARLRVARGELSLTGLCGALRTLLVDGRPLDPSGRSFLDIDTRAEYESARRTHAEGLLRA